MDHAVTKNFGKLRTLMAISDMSAKQTGSIAIREQWRRQDFDKEGAKVSRAKRAQNFDHAHLITSRAASRGMYVHTYVWPMDMIWDGAARSKLYSLSSP